MDEGACVVILDEGLGLAMMIRLRGGHLELFGDHEPDPNPNPNPDPNPDPNPKAYPDPNQNPDSNPNPNPDPAWKIAPMKRYVELAPWHCEKGRFESHVY